jgi:hypothetical protein
MTVLIDGKPIILKPRIAAMLLALIDEQRRIDERDYGTVVIDYAVRTIALRILPAEKATRKDIDRTRYRTA